MAQLGTLIAQQYLTLAAAAAEYINGIKAAQHTARLRLCINSGRFVMLVLLVVLSATAGSSAVLHSCAARNRFAVVQHLGPLNRFVQWVGQLAQQQQNSRGTAIPAVLMGWPAAWGTSTKFWWCIATAAGG